MIGPLVRRAFYFLVPALVFGAIWVSVVDHYYVSNPIITDEIVEQSRHVPQDALLDELSGFHFGELSRAHTVEMAERILQGEFALPGETPRRIRLPFDPRDIDQGSPAWQLFQARLVIPRVLLAAYRITGRENFFLTARDVILGWASYERRALLPKGLLWNDHAVAERILALADFWALYRHHPSYEADAARNIFVLAARSGHFLADALHFTVSTNHGLMQNLALWHLSLAFPSIPQSKRYRELAFERLREQFAFYINDEGFVLEHSAGYHREGVQFISMAFRYMSLQGIPVPGEWRQKYERAQHIYAALRRPDGSLPTFGDTGNGADREGPLVTMLDIEGRYGPLEHKVAWSPPQAQSVYPVAGYTIWWDGLGRSPMSRELSQTVVAWSYFPGLAHKHADEMSVLLWARGQTWWTNLGYLAYGTRGRDEAESWNGSNAPHLTGESTSSLRTTRLLGSGSADGLAFIDLERTGPRGYTARRQVLHAKSTLWVVMDHTSGGARDRTTTIWTTAHDVRVSDGRIPGSYDLTSGSSEAVLTTFILSSAGMSTGRYKGSQVPFASWQVPDDTSGPRSAIMVEQPANDSWAVVVWSLGDNRPPTRRVIAQPSMRSWKGPEKWTMVLPVESGSIRVSREGDRVVVGDDGAKSSTHLTLTRSAGVDRKISEIQDAHEQALRKYPRFNDEMDYRLKATYLAIVVLVLQEAFFALYNRVTRKYSVLLRVLSTIAWVILGLWLVVIRVRLI